MLTLARMDTFRLWKTWVQTRYPLSGPERADLDESHLLGTTVEYASGEVRVATLIADAFDNDNHVEFCMSTPGDPVAITASPGLYEDPNGDLNELHTQVVIDAHDLTP